MDPAAELEPHFSDDDATATSWADAREVLDGADLSWLVTIRPDGRPHVTPLLSVWLDDALYFCTGETERKAKNLETDSRCIIITGCNALGEGLDVVVEGQAAKVTDETRFRRVADRFASKYLPREGARPFHAGLRNGTFLAIGGTTLLYEVTPATAFGFGKGTFSQTRWRF